MKKGIEVPILVSENAKIGVYPPTINILRVLNLLDGHTRISASSSIWDKKQTFHFTGLKENVSSVFIILNSEDIFYTTNERVFFSLYISDAVEIY